jgi:hypothetical protein
MPNNNIKITYQEQDIIKYFNKILTLLEVFQNEEMDSQITD